jgi:hypothetical protein
VEEEIDSLITRFVKVYTIPIAEVKRTIKSAADMAEKSRHKVLKEFRERWEGLKALLAKIEKIEDPCAMNPEKLTWATKRVVDDFCAWFKGYNADIMEQRAAICN